MSIEKRLKKLEEQHAPEVEKHLFVYYHDERGYAATSNGPRFETLDKLSAALEWTPTENDTMLSVIYKDVKVFIPDNGRDPQ